MCRGATALHLRMGVEPNTLVPLDGIEVILGLGLLPATITFMAELLVHLCNKKVNTKADNKIKKAWMP